MSRVHPIITQLRAERERRAISRPRMAALTGWSVHAIEGWEWGDRSPLLDNLADYAQALGYTITLTPKEDQ